MSKAVAILLTQSVLTFIIGLVLASHGLPSNPEDAALQLTDKTLNSTAESIDDLYAQNAIGNGRLSLRIIGIGASIASAIEFIGLIIAQIKT